MSNKNTRGINVFRANVEVILSASSINTPKLLMLSGIGPCRASARTRDRGACRPPPGWKPRITFEIYMQYTATKPITLYKHWNLWGKGSIGAQWLATGTILAPRTSSRAVVSARPRGGISRYPVSFPAAGGAL